MQKSLVAGFIVAAVCFLNAVPIEPAMAQTLADRVDRTMREKAVSEFVRRLDPAGPGAPAEPRFRRYRIGVVQGVKAGTGQPGTQDPPVGVDVVADYAHSARFNVMFEPGSAIVTTDGEFILSLVATALRTPELSRARFLVGGHTDASGAAEANLALSADRAQAVSDVLTGRFGIDPGRLVARGFGETALLNASVPEHPDNRKLEITLLAEAEPAARPYQDRAPDPPRPAADIWAAAPAPAENLNVLLDRIWGPCQDCSR